MRNLDKELNSESRVDETLRVSEGQNSLEWHGVDESYLAKESFGDGNFDEINENTARSKSNSKSKSSGLSAKQLTQYLASVTVVLTATATVVVPVVSSLSVPPVEIVSETVGALSYKCAIGYKGEEIELDALLLTAEGEEVVRYDDIKLSAGIEADVQFSNLYPQTEYELNMIDEKGEVKLEKEFNTAPFVELEEVDQTKIRLNFHQDMLVFEELGIELLSQGGNEFTSNIVYEDNGDRFIYKKGLYASEYTLRVRCYQEEGFYEFSSKITLGELTELNYQASIENFGEMMDIKHELSLIYQSGEFGEYTPVGVTIYSDDYEVYHSFFQEQMNLDGNSVYVSINELIASGEYNVCIWGEFMDGESYYSNQIWLGKIII